MKKIVIVAGARPNFVKVAPLMRAISSADGVDCRLVYAGSAADPTLEASLFNDLQMPRPDVFLGVDSPRLNEITAQVMGRLDRYLDEYPADVVIVVDDLASTMAAAITAKKRGVKVAHLVAGTRSFDITMPKEVNRLVIDALSDYLFTAGMKSNSVATREQQGDTAQTFMVGNILIDTLRFNLPRFQAPTSLDLQPSSYIVLTLNRRVLLADEDYLREMLRTVMAAAEGTPVIAPLRPEAYQKVLAALSSLSSQRVGSSAASTHVLPLNPLPYLEFGWLTAHARGIITDSGNVAEEATFNGVPCATLNDYAEHQETVTVGTNVLVGSDREKLRQAVADMVHGQWKKAALPDRWDGRSAERIVQILLMS
jgi:UDP-N-acetylglucosamine 2-epimerase (non-hydrolysing)